MLLPLFVRIQLALAREEGQTSAEYALVVLAAVTVAVVVGAWAKHTDRIEGLLNTLFDAVTKKIT